jgi:hypothetical protein
MIIIILIKFKVLINLKAIMIAEKINNLMCKIKHKVFIKIEK